MGFKFPYQNSAGHLICGEVGVPETGACGGNPNDCCAPPPRDRCWCRTRVGAVNIDGLMNAIQSGLGKDVLFPLCYADTPIGLADFDFNDYEAFLVGQGGLNCNCQETTCEVTPGNPKTACRETYDASYEDSCTYTCCDSPHDCTPEECTKTTKGTYLSTKPTCQWNLPSQVRFNYNASGNYVASAFDRGDKFQTTAASINKDCLRIYKGGQDFLSLIPQTYRNMVCENSGYSRPRNYNTNLTLVPQGGDKSQYLGNSNICTVKVTAEVAAEGPVGETLTNTCSKDVEVFYPPVIPLALGFIDKNKLSAPEIDGKAPSKMIEKDPLQYVGGIGEDPYQLMQTKIDDILSKGVCTDTRETNEFEYRLGDANPFDLWLDLWDENGPNDFNVTEQEVFLVNQQSQQKYPVNRDASADVSLNVLGLYNISTAMQHLNTGSTAGFKLYPISGDSISAFSSCIADKNNIYCANRFAVEDVNSTRIKNLLSLINGNDPRHQYIEGMPQATLNNPPQGKRIRLRIYQNSLPNGKYYVAVRTKDKEGAKMEYDFTNKTFIVDNTPPNVNMEMTICGLYPDACVENGKHFGGDVLKFSIDITDDSPVNSSLDDYPFFAVFVAAKNSEPDPGNRFLNFWDYKSSVIDGRKVDGRLFRTRLPDGSNIQGLFKVVTNESKHKKYVFYVAGVRGSDEVHYGVCAYDKFGNIKCSWGNNCSGGDVSTQGQNWLKTSLNNVYSKGGFTELPDYRDINKVQEWPVSAVKGFFTNYLSPFKATKATLSTFSVVLNNAASLGLIQWGYEEKYNLSAFKLPSRIITPVGRDIYNNLYSLAKTRCQLLETCSSITINNGSGDLASELKKDTPYKVITVDVNNNKKLDFYNKELVCKNANLIFVSLGQIRLTKIRKAGFKPNNSNNSPFSFYKDGCLFVLAPNAGASIVIDDNPLEQSKIKGVSLTTANDPYGVDTDFIQMGIIALNPSATWDNPQVYVKQTPRDQYRHGGGYFDALILHGFIYSLGVPRLERDLSFGANAKFPSEWIIYDPSLMQLFEPLLGKYKVQTIKCGVNKHPWCRY